MARTPDTADPGLPDALAGVPAPRENLALFGHRAAEDALAAALASGRMHHGWMLTGLRGIGKATLAFRFARFGLAFPEPADAPAGGGLAIPAGNPAIARVARGTHANVLHLHRTFDPRGKRFMTEISVAAIRTVIPFLGNTAGEGGWRFVIVDPADEMNRNAANALLKALEEPPARTVFLLVANRPGLLPATIRSRCRPLRLNPLADADLDAALAAIDPRLTGGPDAALARALAGGSVRRAIELARHDGIALYRALAELVAGGRPGGRSSELAAAAADHRGGGYDRFVAAYETYLHRRVRGLAEPETLPPPPELPLVTWAKLWEKAARSAREVETFNLDRKQFALDLLEAAEAAAEGRLAV